jgi:hypothetical protein
MNNDVFAARIANIFHSVQTTPLSLYRFLKASTSARLIMSDIAPLQSLVEELHTQKAYRKTPGFTVCIGVILICLLCSPNLRLKSHRAT